MIEIPVKGVVPTKNANAGVDPKVMEMVNNITWFGHDSFKIKGSKTVYIDPWKQSTGGDGDLVLVTHEHYDHCSPEDIKKALAPSGKVMASVSCRSVYPDADVFTLPWVLHNDVNGVKVYSTVAYNTDKNFHPPDLLHVGYVVMMDGIKIYHAGDCDCFAHMKDIDCDIALLPVSGTYVMDAMQAVAACEMLKPQVAIPMHWGDPDVVGTGDDAELFKKHAPCKVVILDKL